MGFTIIISLLLSCVGPYVRLATSGDEYGSVLRHLVGRLKITIARQSGTVCSEGFDINEANFICRQLFDSSAESYGTASDLGYALKHCKLAHDCIIRCFTDSYSTELDSPIWLSGLDCTANETNLRACPQAPVGQNNCTHSQDIILSCLVGML